MKVILLMFLSILAPGMVFGFSAVLQTTVETPVGTQVTEWVVSADSDEVCYALRGSGACVGHVVKSDQHYALRINDDERIFQGDVLYDENAEVPWNMLYPLSSDGVVEITARIEANKSELQKKYSMAMMTLSQADVISYGVEPAKGKTYCVMKVFRENTLLAEQVWALGESLWLVDITRTQRTERTSYAE